MKVELTDHVAREKSHRIATMKNRFIAIFLLVSIGLTCALAQLEPSPTLRSLADARGMYMGAAVAPIFYDTTEPDYGMVLAREYNMVVAENIMKWSALSSGRGKFSFNAADGMVAFAQKNKQAVRGHTLVWHESLPSWVLTIKDKNEMQAVLKNHVQTVARYFKGKVFAWDVLNEAILEDGSYRKTPFYNLLGEGYIADVFRWAREADPNAKLFYNDYNTDGINKKSTAVFEMVKKLKSQGIPIDGVGFQAHIDSNFNVQQQRTLENLERFKALGLEVQMTEVDVQLSGNAPKAERLAAQAKVYGDMLRACLAAKCSAFITWGFTDAFSWRAGSSPLPFDSSYQPKPAYFALLEVLKNPTVTMPAVAAPAPTSSALEFASFADASKSLQGGAIVKTEYNEKAGDAKVDGISVTNGVLTVDYRLSKQAGSTFAGAGVGVNALENGKTISLVGYNAMRLQVASSQAKSLRIRISSTDQAIINAGCYPVVFLDVSPDLKTYTIPLEKFAPLGYCGSNARTLAQVISNVLLVEIADEGLPSSGVRQGQIRIGKIEFLK